MPQFARPISDVAVGDWAAAPLHYKLGEVAPSDDNFISGEGSSYCEVRLGSLRPPVSGGVSVRFRYRLQPGSESSALLVRLMMGDTLIASRTFPAETTVMTTASFTLTGAERALITGWADLRLRFGADPTPSSVHPDALWYGANTLAYGTETLIYG
jgi:hypothetical protein